MTLARLFFLLVIISLSGIQKTFAEETDQFTLPPTELYDMGPMASAKLYDVLNSVIAQTNAELRMYQARANISSHAAAQLAKRQSDIYLADLLYQRTGPGFPRWLRWNRSEKYSKPIEFRERWPWNTVYWLFITQSPFFLVGLTPTVNMYNYYFGTDKFGHFFMQGHSYYKLYMFCLAHGKSKKQAREVMVTYGEIIEQTYLGTMINSVYSNADLSANYAGWKFYMNLAHSVRIGDKTLSPILELKDNQWQFSKRIDKNTLLKPYMSDHLNEALNPSRYLFLQGQIRRQVKKRCADWIERKGLTQQFVQAKLDEVKLWHNEPYGHWLTASNAVTLNACFGGK